jgi:hypothetical protein
MSVHVVIQAGKDGLCRLLVRPLVAATLQTRLP